MPTNGLPFVEGGKAEWLGAWACPSHRHGHLVVLIQPFLFIKGHFGIVTIQLEGGRGKGERPGQEEPFWGRKRLL